MSEEKKKLKKLLYDLSSADDEVIAFIESRALDFSGSDQALLGVILEKRARVIDRYLVLMKDYMLEKQKIKEGLDKVPGIM